jgi:hypothetical protein
MNQTNNYSSLSHTIQNTIKPKNKKCKGCNKKRKIVNEIYQTCLPCYKVKTVNLSGNKVIDNFIINILSKRNPRVKLEIVSYDRFKNIEFVNEGGFSKIYKAIWVDGPISNKWDEVKQDFRRFGKITVALKELNNSKNIESKELNEVK